MFAMAAALVGSACEPAHIQPYTPKEREVPAVPVAAAPKPPPKGSLWRHETQAAHLFADQRAFRQSDIVVVQVEERADAQRSADTATQRSTGGALALSALPVVGPLAGLALGNLNTDVSASASADGNYSAEGKTGRSERLIATVPAVVKEVLPNGNLVIEGQRVVLVNHEEQHLYVSGIVRPIDIDEHNEIKSSMIAEAEIEFVGRGVLSDNEQGGWMTRALRVVWPF